MLYVFGISALFHVECHLENSASLLFAVFLSWALECPLLEEADSAP